MILNLTQHAATAEQITAGVVDLLPEALECLQALLTFKTLPTRAEVNARAREIAQLAQKGAFDHAMIGGAPYLMAALESALLDEYITPVYAFSERISSEETQADGSVRKVNVFKHAGFVPAIGGTL